MRRDASLQIGRSHPNHTWLLDHTEEHGRLVLYLNENLILIVDPASLVGEHYRHPTHQAFREQSTPPLAIVGQRQVRCRRRLVDVQRWPLDVERIGSLALGLPPWLSAPLYIRPIRECLTRQRPYACNYADRAIALRSHRRRLGQNS